MGKKKGKDGATTGTLKKSEAQEWLRVHTLLHDFLNQRLSVVPSAVGYDAVRRLGMGERMSMQAVLDSHTELVEDFLLHAKGVGKSEKKCAAVFAK